MGKKYKRKTSFDPFAQDSIEASEDCEHVFLPVDSTEKFWHVQNAGLLLIKKI